jgi:hypothetical protein
METNIRFPLISPNGKQYSQPLIPISSEFFLSTWMETNIQDIRKSL